MGCDASIMPKTQYSFNIPFVIYSEKQGIACTSLIVVTVAAEFASPTEGKRHICEHCARDLSKDVLRKNFEEEQGTFPIEQLLN